MRTRVAIVGAGPAGLMLAQVLHLEGIDSVVIDPGPAVCVDRHGVTRADPGIEDPDVVVLEDHPVVLGRRDERIELLGPLPAVFGTLGCRHTRSVVRCRV